MLIKFKRFFKDQTILTKYLLVVNFACVSEMSNTNVVKDWFVLKDHLLSC
jgi:hypothetical protein